MKKSLLLLASFLGLSYAQAYTLNLPNNSVFENRKCSLKLGKKKSLKRSFYHKQGGTIQPAVLKTSRGTHPFELIEERGKTDQVAFGRPNIPGVYYATYVHIKKVGDEALDIDVTLENASLGWSDFYDRCGVMILK